MEYRFVCPSCGQRLKAENQDAGRLVDCPRCAKELRVPPPPPNPHSTFQPPPMPPPGTGISKANLEGTQTCPVCWLRFDTGDIMHIAMHDSLRGDPLLGIDAQQRFLATRFDNAGQALDAMGIPSSEIACPHCRRKLPRSFLGIPHHIISLVGDQSAGKSYFLSVLTKMLPATLYSDFGVTWLESDPTGNAPVNDMRKALFGAIRPEEAKLAKTVFEGAMYEKLPRQGRMVALPRPFIYTIIPRRNTPAKQCALIFYDNAGEHFQPGVDIHEQPGAQHVASASGIIYLFDPFNSPEFRRAISNTKDPQLEKPVVDQQDTILAEMRVRIHAIRNLRPHEVFSTPIAFVVGKCDAWLPLLNGQPITQPIHTGILDQGAIDRNSTIVRELMHRLCPSVVANATALSTNVMFFAASSFGHTPVKTSRGDYVPDPSQLKPFHVEVPTLWLLSQIYPPLLPSGNPAGSNPSLQKPARH